MEHYRCTLCYQFKLRDFAPGIWRYLRGSSDWSLWTVRFHDMLSDLADTVTVFLSGSGLNCLHFAWSLDTASHRALPPSPRFARFRDSWEPSHRSSGFLWSMICTPLKVLSSCIVCWVMTDLSTDWPRMINIWYVPRYRGCGFLTTH
jgi:hypothetical protein